MKKFLATLFSTAVVTGFFAAPAQAREIERQGTCSQGSFWEASVELEYSVHDLDFDIDTRVANQTWTMTLTHNKKKVRTQARTAIKDYDDSYAEVEWDFIRRNQRGADTFTFRAVNDTTGEICRVTIKN